MRTIDISVSLTEYDSPAELPQHEQELLEKARKAGELAYAPYSNFHVGAALLLENGVIVTGNNQENMAYPSGLCAERVAIFAAGAQYPDVAVKAVAVVCTSTSFTVDKPGSPCGACRQVLAEYEMRHGKNIRLLMMGEKGKVHAVNSIGQLLPLVFRMEELKKR
jgi:cytidine deaminase